MPRPYKIGQLHNFYGYRRKTMIQELDRVVMLIALSFAACIPAQTPPQLAHTPGAPVVVAGSRVETTAFAVDAPSGWRIITSPAALPPFLIFAAPDGCALITLAAEPIEPPPLTNCPTDAAAPTQQTRRITFEDGTPVYATFSATPTNDDSMLPIFEAVIESLATVR
jgi:hypothetical protein